MERELRIIRITLISIFMIILLYLMADLSSLLVPLFLALFLAVLVEPVLKWFERKKIHFKFSFLFVWLATLGILYGIVNIIVNTVRKLVDNKVELTNQLNTKLTPIFAWINSQTWMNFEATDLGVVLGEFLSPEVIMSSSEKLATALGSFTTGFFLTGLYLLGFIGALFRYERIIPYLTGENKHEKLMHGFIEVKSALGSYIMVKFWISLGTGVFMGLVCWIFGVPFALFWGFMGLVLNFIPTIGSLVAIIGPVLMGFVVFDQPITVLWFFVILLFVQVFFGNFLEPKFVGSGVNINFVVVVFALVFWGTVFGIPGMILSVPIMVLIKAVLAQTTDGQFIVKLLSSKKELLK